MSTAILLVGIVVYSTQGFPEFEPLAMLGGMFWALGKSFLVYLVTSNVIIQEMRRQFLL